MKGGAGRHYLCGAGAGAGDGHGWSQATKLHCRPRVPVQLISALIMEDNPFCMLFPSVEDVHNASVIALRQKLAVSDVLTRIFLFTAATGMTPYIVESLICTSVQHLLFQLSR